MELKKGLNIISGHVVYKEVSDAFNLNFKLRINAGIEV